MPAAKRLTQHQKLDNLTTEVTELKVGQAELRVSITYINKFLWMIVGVTTIGTLESVFKLFTNHLPHWIAVLKGG